MSINQRTTNTHTNTQKCIADAQKLLRAGQLNTIQTIIIPQSTFTCEREEILTMIDGSSNQKVEIPSEMDETRFASDATDNSVAAFLARPLKIAHWDWSTATPLATTVNPWKLFLENKRVVNRIATFKLLRGNMRIKVMINGNSFFFGRLMLSYLPLHSFDSLSQIPTGTSDYGLVQFSQLPRIFLDPATSQGGEMSLPFFWHNDYVDLLSDDKDKLGQLALTELTTLEHCNGSASLVNTVSVTMYAWMEDVELQAPTSGRASYIVAQSTGFKPYAKGSQMPGSKNHADPNPDLMVPRGVSSMTLTDCADTSNRLTFTKQQETSLDPRILGLSDKDELDIRHIASRESYLRSFQWNLSSNAETLLYNLRVTPTLHRKFSFTSIIGPNPVPAHDAYCMPACCGAVLPFAYWNGTFKLRLQIVASAFHRGRLAIVYDPHGTTAVREDNVQYTHIVDIATCRDVTFKVGPNQDRTMLTYLDPGPATEIIDSDTTALSPATHGNGTVSIYVLNELTLPNPAAGTPSVISINTFVSIDDLDVFVPSGSFSKYVIKPQSTGAEVPASAEDLVEESDAYNTTALSLDQSIPVSSKRHLVYGGEIMTSFRTMLNRYYPWATIRLAQMSTSSDLRFVQFNHRMFPAYRGNVPGAVHTAAGAIPGNVTNYFQMTLLNYLAPAFQGWRGSVRYKMFPRYTTQVRGTALVSFTTATSYAVTPVDVLVSPTVANDSNVARGSMFSGPYLSKATGTHVTVKQVNPSVEYEVPWWEPIRFCPGKPINWTTGATTRDVPDSGAHVCIDQINNGGSCAYDVHVAAGDDFTFYFFTGWPPMMSYTEAPPL